MSHLSIEDRERMAFLADNRPALDLCAELLDAEVEAKLAAEEAKVLTAAFEAEYDRAEKAEGMTHGRGRLIDLVVELLRATKPLKKAQMVALADLLDFYNLDDNVPAERSEEAGVQHHIKEALA